MSRLHAPDAPRTRSRPALHERSPLRAAVLSLVTVSIYGFWWWWDLNRQLRALGQPARPWQALGLVMLGWLVVAPAVMAGWPWVAAVLSVIPAGLSLVAVGQTATMLYAAQRARGVVRAVSVPLALGLSAMALACIVAWFTLMVVETGSVSMFLGVLGPFLAMTFVVYLQSAFNDVAGGTP
jgi:hypothetical protein